MAEAEEFITEQVDQQAPPPEPLADEGAEQEPAKPSIRQHIEKGFDDARQEKPEKAAKEPKQRQKSSARSDQQPDAKEIKEQWREPAKPDTQLKSDSQAQEQTQTTAAPKAWDKNAQAEWNSLPPAVQAAVVKRETDISNGVQQLRSRYTEIDEAVKPHLEAISSNGFTPGQAVGQLFQWFKALHDNPVVAFPALAQSFGLDLNRLVTAAQQHYEQQQIAQQQEQQQIDQIPPYIRQALERTNMIEQRLNSYEQSQAQQNEARTHEVINTWAKDKPHFEKVRNLMGQLIQSGAVALKDGRVDLDAAYSKACRADDDIWQTMSQAQQVAATNAINQATDRQRQAQQRGANKARQAAVSIASSAPGLNNTVGKSNQPKKGMSVRESLLAAKDEVLGNQA